MQLDSVSVRLSHLRDFLPLADLLVFLDEQGLVVCVRGQERVVVFEDDQIAITPQTRTRIHHLTIRRGQDRVTRLACNVQTFVLHFIKGTKLKLEVS